MKAKLETIPFFFLTIPGFFLLYNNNYYFGLLEWSLIDKEMLLYCIAPFLLLPLLKFAFKSWQKSALLIGWFMILFYFFEPFHQAIKSIPLISFIGKYMILIPLLIILLVWMIYYLKGTGRSFHRSYGYLNVLFFLLVFFETILLIYFSGSGKVLDNDLADKEKKLSKNFKACDTCIRPDIYFLIFDEYTNQKTLRTEFNYPNSEMISYLRTKGFYVADHSKSNYNHTHLSLSSELNLNYLPSIYEGKKYFTKDFLKGDYTIYKNELFIILRKLGYQVYNHSIFDIQKLPQSSVSPFRKEFFSFIYDQTLYNKLNLDIGWNFRKEHKQKVRINAQQRKMVEEDQIRFEETRVGIINCAKDSGKRPSFIYAHFLLPHRPYYFDSIGMRPDYAYLDLSSDNKEEYLQQLVYTNKFIIKPLIDSIFTFSSRPFIVLLQSDHGYRKYPLDKQLLEFENLNAIYFHDKNYSQLYSSITSVNTFRVVLNKYFNAQLPILKDSSFFLPHLAR